MGIFKKHDPYYTKEGYKQVYRPNSSEARNNGYAPEHRHKMSKKLGRPLSSNEIVHHIDGDKHNNKTKNLQLMSRKEHWKTHHPK